MCKKLRSCLKCRIQFLSSSAGNRLCGECTIKNRKIVITPTNIISIKRKRKTPD